MICETFYLHLKGEQIIKAEYEKKHGYDINKRIIKEYKNEQ